MFGFGGVCCLVVFALLLVCFVLGLVVLRVLRCVCLVVIVLVVWVGSLFGYVLGWLYL